MVVLLFLGCLMETSSIILLTVPILQPIMVGLGVDMIHFGVICVVNLAIGMLTPPVGVALFTTAGISKVTMGQIIHKVWPMLFVLILGMFIMVFFPSIVTFLPELLMSS